MKTALIAVSEKGAALARVIKARLPASEAFVYAPYAGEDQTPFQKVTEIARELWAEYEGLVFLCASGIAVRAIAPFVSSKHTDPAVVVAGDDGAYAVSLLSGHEGGANGLAAEIAACSGGIPVISTASEASPRPLPRNLIAGMGCRRGISGAALLAALEGVFASQRLSLLRLRAIATIDIKKDEKGFRDLAEKIGVPLLFFSAEELNAAPGEFKGSEFVKKITGTDNVSERAASLGAAAGGRVIVAKQVLKEGITVAVCEKTMTEAEHESTSPQHE